MRLADLLLVAIAAAALAGCEPRPEPAAPAPPPETRTDIPDLPPVSRATASDILAAAQSGVVPDWFTPEERNAVAKLRE